MFFAGFGVLCFGLVIGWISHRTLRLSATPIILSDVATIVEVVGSALVVALLKSDVLFGLYAIGLILGFFVYFLVALQLYGKQDMVPWPNFRLPRFRVTAPQPVQPPVDATDSTETHQP